MATILAFAFGGYFYVDKTYARDATVQQIEQRLDVKILRDTSRDLRGEIYIVQDRYAGQEMPYEKQQLLRKMKDDKADIDRELDIIIQELRRKK